MGETRQRGATYTIDLGSAAKRNSFYNSGWNTFFARAEAFSARQTGKSLARLPPESAFVVLRTTRPKKRVLIKMGGRRLSVRHAHQCLDD